MGTLKLAAMIFSPKVAEEEENYFERLDKQLSVGWLWLLSLIYVDLPSPPGEDKVRANACWGEQKILIPVPPRTNCATCPQDTSFFLLLFPP